MQTVGDRLHIDILRDSRADRTGVSVVDAGHRVEGVGQAVCARLDRPDAGIIIRVGMTDADQCAAFPDEFH